MNKRKIGLVCIFILALSVSHSFCEENATYNEVQVGSHALTILQDIGITDSKGISGVMVSYQRALKKHIALRAGLYFDESSEDVDWVVSGIETQIFVGTDFITPGWYVDAGLGYFSEIWGDHGLSDNKVYNGGLLSLGIGYRFKSKVVFDYTMSLRGTSDYDEGISKDIGVFATSNVLTIGFCF